MYLEHLYLLSMKSNLNTNILQSIVPMFSNFVVFMLQKGKYLDKILYDMLNTTTVNPIIEQNVFLDLFKEKKNTLCLDLNTLKCAKLIQYKIEKLCFNVKCLFVQD